MKTERIGKITFKQFHRKLDGALVTIEHCPTTTSVWVVYHGQAGYKTKRPRAYFETLKEAEHFARYEALSVMPWEEIFITNYEHDRAIYLDGKLIGCEGD